MPPTISILMATRGRVPYLRQSVDSLYSLAQNKDGLQFVFKVDSDDTATIEAVTQIKDMGVNCIVLQSPRGNGYADIHHWFNQMAFLATGEWLFVFNDDAIMKTQNWDTAFITGVKWAENARGHKRAYDVCCYTIDTVGQPDARGFFFLPKKTVEILGCISRIPHIDTWFTTMIDMVGSSYWNRSIQVEHIAEGMNDDTRKDGDATRKTVEFTADASLELRKQKIIDMLVLMNYLTDDKSTPQYDLDTELFLSLFGESPPGKFLEVGAHDEPVANIMADKGFEVYGVDLRTYDPTEYVPGRGREKAPPLNYTFVQADFCDLPDDFIKAHIGTFDYAVSLSAIEHFGLNTYKEGINSPHYDTIGVHWMYKMLKPGGVCYVTVPLGGKHLECPPHWRVYSFEEISRRLVGKFKLESYAMVVAAEIEIDGVKYHRGNQLTHEQVAKHTGPSPHITILLKLIKESK